MVIFAPSNRVLVDAFMKNLPPKSPHFEKKSSKNPPSYGRFSSLVNKYGSNISNRVIMLNIVLDIQRTFWRLVEFNMGEVQSLEACIQEYIVYMMF